MLLKRMCSIFLRVVCLIKWPGAGWFLFSLLYLSKIFYIIWTCKNFIEVPRSYRYYAFFFEYCLVKWISWVLMTYIVYKCPELTTYLNQIQVSFVHCMTVTGWRCSLNVSVHTFWKLVTMWKEDLRTGIACRWESKPSWGSSFNQSPWAVVWNSSSEVKLDYPLRLFSLNINYLYYILRQVLAFISQACLKPETLLP